jgi:hypothetical protein
VQRALEDAVQVEHRVEALVAQPPQARRDAQLLPTRIDVHGGQLRMVLQQRREAVLDEELDAHVGPRVRQRRDGLEREQHVAERRQAHDQHAGAVRQRRGRRGWWR